MTADILDRATKSRLLNVCDELTNVRSLIDVAWMAARCLQREDCDAIQTALIIARDRLAEQMKALNDTRGAPTVGENEEKAEA